jgi:hypothetical protein
MEPLSSPSSNKSPARIEDSLKEGLHGEWSSLILLMRGGRPHVSAATPVKWG